MTATFRFLILAAGLSAAAADSPEPEPTTVKDRAGFLPKRAFPALKGTAVGVMAADVTKVMGEDGRGGPPDAYAFSSDAGSYRWVYVPVTEKELITNLRVEVGDKPGRVKVYPKLSMANAALLAPMGVKVPYSLVEVEVNDGEGTPATEGFVATKFTRIDGTPKAPLDVAATVEKAKKMYAAHVKLRAKKIDAAMKAQEKTALKGRAMTGPKESSEVMYLTWLTKERRLQVRFRTRQTDGAYQEVEGGAGRGPFGLPPPPKPGVKGGLVAMRFPPPPPPRGKVKVGVTVGAELGVIYEFDHKGELVSTRELEVQGFSQELMAPP